MKKIINYSNRLVDGTRSIELKIDLPNWVAGVLLVVLIGWVLLK